ncbi:MAG: hypothetical protein LBI13_08490 [Streptococcaceae bacterium]|jgi:hypothetical protein|nr:hypothetical protein [Streptococcaceae bacterium]
MTKKITWAAPDEIVRAIVALLALILFLGFEKNSVTSIIVFSLLIMMNVMILFLDKNY